MGNNLGDSWGLAPRKRQARPMKEYLRPSENPFKHHSKNTLIVYFPNSPGRETHRSPQEDPVGYSIPNMYTALIYAVEDSELVTPVIPSR